MQLCAADDGNNKIYGVEKGKKEKRRKNVSCCKQNQPIQIMMYTPDEFIF